MKTVYDIIDEKAIEIKASFGDTFIGREKCREFIEELEDLKNRIKRESTMEKIIDEIRAIAEDGILPDGDFVNLSTIGWAERCLERLTTEQEE